MRFSLTYGVTEEKDAVELSQLFLLLRLHLVPRLKSSQNRKSTLKDEATTSNSVVHHHRSIVVKGTK